MFMPGMSCIVWLSCPGGMSCARTPNPRPITMSIPAIELRKQSSAGDSQLRHRKRETTFAGAHPPRRRTHFVGEKDKETGIRYAGGQDAAGRWREANAVQPGMAEER